MIGVQAQSWTVGAEVAAGDYYLYNIGADRYLSNGASWSTHSVVDGQGVVITVEVKSGKYALKSNVGGGAGPYVWGDWTNNDNGDNGWYFAKVDCDGYTNAYTLQQTNAEGTFLYWGNNTGAWGNEVYGSGASANGKNSYWLLIPKATRQNLGAASPSNPLDVTYLIGDPDFEKRVSNNTDATPKDGSGQTSPSWTCGGFYRKYSEQAVASGIFFEKWSGSGLTTADKIYQSPTLKAGKYRLTASATSSCTKAYLYAGTTKTQIPNAVGIYAVDFTVASEGAVELGVQIEAGGTGKWVAFDNVRLYYLGNDVSSKITNPNFDSDASGWTGAGTHGNSEIEFYNNTDGFDMYQDISGLDAGIYAVELQGFYRNGAGIDEKRAKAQESLLASIYAKGKDDVERSTSLLSIYEEAGKVTAYGSLFGDIPNWMNQAQDFISAGYYKDNKVIVEVGAAGTLRIGAKKTGGISADWTILDNFSLTKLNYASLAEAYAAEWTARKTSAQALLNNGDYSNIVSGSTQRTALSSAVSATPSDLAGYISALAALRTAVNNFKAAKYAYNLYATKAAAATEVYDAEGTTYINVTGEEKTTFNTAYTTYVSSFSPATNNAENYYNAAVAIGSATDAFTDETIKNNYNEYAAEVATATLLETDASGVATPTTSSAALTAAHSINVLNYNKIVAEEYDDVSGSTLGAWTDTNVGERSGQHWDGTNESKYFEMNSGWGDTSWNMSRSQTVNLAAGKYILKVACRVSTYANATLSVIVGGNTISTISGHQGDNGKGITTSGVASYNEGTFANTTGRGFEWKYIPFELAETGNATLSFSAEGHAQYQYVSFTSLALLTDPKVAARTSLLNKINEATGARKSANEGTGVFQIPAAAGTTFSGAIDAAQGVYDDDDADLGDITSATTTLNTAIGTYESAELNAPDAEKRYCFVVATTGHAQTGKAFGIALGETSDSNPTGYTINTGNTTNQSVAFTHVSGNTYNVSFETAAGTTYMTYGTTNESTADWSDSQIQATTDAEKKGNFVIIATDKANVFNIQNTLTNTTIACQSGGNIYTEAGNADFTLVEATSATMQVSGTAKMGTFCAPFDVAIPDGVTAYEASMSSDNWVHLEEIEDGVIDAGTPVILSITADDTFSQTFYGVNTAEDPDDSGVLKGLYVAETKESGENPYYIMQYSDGKTAFFRVPTGQSRNLGANRCYLQPESNLTPARIAIGGEDDDFTAIDELKAIEAEAKTMKDGKYLVKGRIVIVKNGKAFDANGQKLK